MKSYKEKVNELGRESTEVRLLSADELARLKSDLLDIYMDIQEVCDRNGIRCMLLGGSALGAIRHKGFIPWDDDFDVGMPREDYERFKSIFKDELGKKYILNGPNYEGNPTNRFPKVLKKGTRFIEAGMREDDDRACIKIDIFILENVPDCTLIKNIKGLYCTGLMFIYGRVCSYEAWKQESSKKPMTVRQLMGMPFSFCPSKKWADRVDNACKYRNNNTKFMGIPTGRKHYFGEILPREVFLPPKQGVFEGKSVYLPAQTDLYLKNLYGEYMTLPPEEKREHHYIKTISF